MINKQDSRASPFPKQVPADIIKVIHTINPTTRRLPPNILRELIQNKGAYALFKIGIVQEKQRQFFTRCKNPAKNLEKPLQNTSRKKHVCSQAYIRPEDITKGTEDRSSGSHSVERGSLKEQLIPKNADLLHKKEKKPPIGRNVGDPNFKTVDNVGPCLVVNLPFAKHMLRKFQKRSTRPRENSLSKAELTQTQSCRTYAFGKLHNNFRDQKKYSYKESVSQDAGATDAPYITTAKQLIDYPYQSCRS